MDARGHRSHEESPEHSTFSVGERVLVSVMIATICAFAWLFERLPDRHHEL
ncbi:MAG: hypothetical protein JOZ99_15465 [Actinobacteria bacterium]|nr:hypothetical protein [Actinomycetota bacterium]